MIAAGAGNDEMQGDSGRDTMLGGAGADTMFGKGGRDTMDGGAGDDVIDGGNKDDVITGGDGNDCMKGGGGKDTLNGGNGADVLNGGGGKDTLNGGKGNDDLFGTADDFTFTTDTNASGNYLFTAMPDGIFRLTPDTGDIPLGTAPSFDVDGTIDGVANFTMAGSPTRTDVDFGFVGQRTISDQFWFDINGDGVKSVDEPGLGGVTVQLQRTGPNGAFTVTTTTPFGPTATFVGLQQPEKPLGSGPVNLPKRPSNLPLRS